MGKTYSGVVGFLELQKDRLVNYMMEPSCGYAADDIHMLIGAGYNAACALNLMGLCPDDELQTIGLMVTQLLGRC